MNVKKALTAAARRIQARSIRRRGGKTGGWQAEAWTMYDLVGELHYLAGTFADRASAARFYIGTAPEDDDTGIPVPVPEGSEADVLDMLGTQAQRTQMIRRLVLGIYVPGEGWLVGLNDEDTEAGVVWHALSTSEVKTSTAGDGFDLTIEDRTVTVAADDTSLIRIWQPHPRRAIEADSPVRATLPILRELVGLTEYVSSQIDSRLAGAGVLLYRRSLEDQYSDEGDNFADDFTDSMITPISDRSNASARVPFLLGVPDDGSERAVADYMHHISFATELDMQATQLRDEAIRRLALGLDTPPEILLGMSSANHWGAWLVREDTITTHIEPVLQLIVDALTTQWLHPILAELGVAEPERYVVWYNVDHLKIRTDEAENAINAFDRDLISADAARSALGYSDNDAPGAPGPMPAEQVEVIDTTEVSDPGGTPAGGF